MGGGIALVTAYFVHPYSHVVLRHCPVSAKIFADGQTVKVRTSAFSDLDGKPAGLIVAANT